MAGGVGSGGEVQGQLCASGVFARKGKVAPVTVDICNIHTSNYQVSAEKVSAQLKHRLPVTALASILIF